MICWMRAENHRLLPCCVLQSRRAIHLEKLPSLFVIKPCLKLAVIVRDVWAAGLCHRLGVASGTSL